jgi:hypothetical protein
MIMMAHFIPFEKLSKKEKKKQNNLRHQRLQGAFRRSERQHRRGENGNQLWQR